ncbi:hypothetical protein [Alicyclobacillus mengziensis]|uniref:Uncharacterized protein n=1 Tax=Alicyclobacillus mengziensis TaxID=2931921 RepID=A0A9X7W2Q5_9BACL|nr:hypothetical protein [Alicyclobacillus mengziensis]QSO49539.1 hypothetical protein JZ786_11945 [Alicyclobacillus mengziensis]
MEQYEVYIDLFGNMSLYEDMMACDLHRSALSAVFSFEGTNPAVLAAGVCVLKTVTVCNGTRAKALEVRVGQGTD